MTFDGEDETYLEFVFSHEDFGWQIDLLAGPLGAFPGGGRICTLSDDCWVEMGYRSRAFLRLSYHCLDYGGGALSGLVVLLSKNAP